MDMPQPPPLPAHHTASDTHGRYVRTEASKLRDARAVELRAHGRTYQQIADELGYGNKGDAWRAVQRLVTEVTTDRVEELITVEAARLDELYVEALEILQRDHYAHSHGRVVELDGQPLLDDGPKLQAIDRLVKIRESYRRLHGLDAPSRVSVEAEQLGREIGKLLDSALGPDGDDADA